MGKDKPKSPSACARDAYNAQCTADARQQRGDNLALAPDHMLSNTERAMAVVARACRRPSGPAPLEA